jgi:hypothetical protein
MKNWKTTLAGIIGLLTQTIPQVQAALNGQPVDWHQIIFGLVIGILGVLAKDFNVNADAAVKLLVACLCVSSITGCSTLERWQANPKVQAAEREAWKILESAGLNAAATYATGGKLDTAWAVPVALNSISTAVKDTVTNEQAAALIQSTVQQFACDPQFQHVGQDLAKAFVAANPTTPQEKQAVVVAMSTGASNGVAAAAQQ